MKLLVIEDSAEIRNMLVNSFKDECYSVDSAEDGEAGAKLARENNYDLIVLDNVMPKKTGKEVCKELRSEGISTPIITVSVLSDMDTKVDLLNAGADDYMSKPFSFQELAARARALTRRKSEILPSILKVDDLILDTATFTATRGGKKIDLTCKEFLLLEYLMRNEGHVLTRAMIMERVWDMNADPFSNTIETHVATLRRKLKVKGKPQTIQTIHGRGYKMEKYSKLVQV